MEIDVKKVLGKQCENDFEISDAMIKSQQEVIEALHIMQSTIENWNDADCREFNKQRMIKYFNKFSK